MLAGQSVGLVVEIDGVECAGSVTMSPAPVNGVWCAHGTAPEQWVSGELLLRLTELGCDVPEVLARIERAAALSCERNARV